MKKMCVSTVVLLIIIIYMVGVAYANPIDNTNHWAYEISEEYFSKGYFDGFVDSIDLDRDISRGEFVSIVNRLLNLEVKESDMFSDIDSTNSFYTDVSTSRAYGYIRGYGDNTFREEEEISRQEVATIIYRLISLDSLNIDYIEHFIDSDSIPEWSNEMLNSIVGEGIMTGYPDGSIRVDDNISIGEVIKVLDSTFGYTVNDSNMGVKATDVEKHLTVSTADVVLSDLLIAGNLIISPGVGEGDVYLNNVTVEGRTIINGGGINSIHLKNSQLSEVLVNKKNGMVRIVCEEDTKVGNTLVKSSALLEEDSSSRQSETGFFNVTIEIYDEDNTVQLDGGFGEVVLKSQAKINSFHNTSINLIDVEELSDGSTIELSDESIVSVIKAKSKLEVVGKGIIKKAEIKSDGVKFNQKVEEITMDPEIASIEIENQIVRSQDDYNNSIVKSKDKKKDVKDKDKNQKNDCRFTKVDSLKLGLTYTLSAVDKNHVLKGYKVEYYIDDNWVEIAYDRDNDGKVFILGKYDDCSKMRIVKDKKTYMDSDNDF